MGPISAIGTTGTSMPRQVTNTTAPSGASGTGSIATTSMAVSRVNSSVAQMLQNIGGGIEDNKMLRMLIAALVLLALLEEAQAGGDNGTNLLSGLGEGQGSRSQYVGIFSSSTTVSIEQTSTTIFFASDAAAIAPDDPGNLDGAASSGDIGSQLTSTELDYLA